MHELNSFHILNRGVDKRDVFLDDCDYIRFIHNINDFNTTELLVNISYYKRRQEKYNQNKNMSVVRSPTEDNQNKNMSVVRSPTEEIVDVLCWTLLSNHVHILAVYKGDKTIGEYSKKIFGGYTEYFNEKYDRSGVLFQGRTKIKPVESEAYFWYLPFYIHLNTLDEIRPGWRENGIKDPKKAIEEAINYRWSNLRDIVGEGNGEFAHITNKELFFEMFDTNEEKYKKNFEDWIKNKEYKNTDFYDFE